MEEFWSKEFPITSVTRADLIATGIPRTVVEKLSDDDMRRIALVMEDIYCVIAIGRMYGWLLKKSKERTVAKNLCVMTVKPDKAYKVKRENKLIIGLDEIEANIASLQKQMDNFKSLLRAQQMMIPLTV